MLSSFCIGLFISLLQIRFMVFSAGSFESEGCVTNTAKNEEKNVLGGNICLKIINNGSVLGAVGLFQDALSWTTKAFEFVISTSRDTCNVVGQFCFLQSNSYYATN